MLIVSNIKEEGVFNLDNIIHLKIKRLDSSDGDRMYFLYFTSNDVKPGFIGQWNTKEKAEQALEDILKYHHLGSAEVYLHD